jgi:LuxR family maltose regulon positive regulatory protein
MQDNISNTVLTTKLQQPDLPGDFIPRPHLLALLNKDIHRPLTLISAGAGFGKSTLASSWLRELPGKTAWLSLDSNDNDLRIFLIHFVAAVQSSFATSMQKTRQLLETPQLPGTNVLKNSLINDLNILPDRLFLAIDDFYVVRNKEIFYLVSEMLNFPPGKFHLIIITRYDPPIPLARLRSQKKVIEIRSAQLRLNEKEIRQFVKKNIKSGDPDPISEVLDSKLEGWFTGLRLAMLRLSFYDPGKEELDKIAFASEYSEAYLLEEVLEHLEKRILDFLLKTSVLRSFTPGLTDLLIEASGTGQDSREIIEELTKNNIFVINLDNNREWFRYHHFFGSFLQKELKKRFPEGMIAELHRKASVWYEKKNMIEEALFHAMKTHEEASVAGMIENHMHKLLNENKWYILEKWINIITEPSVRESPAILIARMWITYHRNELWLIPELLTTIEKKVKDKALNKIMKLQIKFFQAMMLFWSVRIKESIPLFYEVRQRLPEKMVGARSQANIHYALALQMNGTGKETYRELNEMSYSDQLAPTYKVMLFGSLIFMKLIEGDLRNAEKVAIRTNDFSNKINDAFAQGWCKYFLGYIAFQQNRLLQAEGYFTDALKNLYHLNTIAPIDTFAGLLLTRKALDKSEAYKETYEQMLDYVEEKTNPSFRTFSNSVRARLALLENDLTTATEMVNTMDLFFDSGNVLFHITSPRLIYIRVLLAQDKPEKTEEAIEKLNTCLQLAESIHNLPFLIHTLIILSVAYKKKNEIRKAERMLARAVEKAAPGNWLRPFLEFAPQIGDLLHEIKVRDRALDFLSRLTSETNNSPVTRYAITDRSQYLLDPMTNRELDILSLLAERLTNKEIAEQLFISLATVKRHTINIYQKLDVHKRREAVEKAKTLGII